MPIESFEITRANGCVCGNGDDRASSISSATFISGIFFTNSRKKSKRFSDIMHCFICDGVNVFAFRAFVIRNVLVSIDSTNNSNVRGIHSVKEN